MQVMLCCTSCQCTGGQIRPRPTKALQMMASPLERGESWEDCTLWALLRPVMGCESSRPESDALGSTLWWCLCHSSDLQDAVQLWTTRWSMSS